MKTRPHPVVRAGLLASCLVFPAHAQSTDLIEQARLRSAMLDVRPGAPEQSSASPLEESGEQAVETPGDLDLGVQLIMKPKVRPRPFRLFATLSEYYTDNVGLAESDTESDTYFFTEIGLRYENKISETINIEATIRQAFFRYHEFDGLDFESMNAGVGLGYKIPELTNVTLFARYNLERLTNDDFGNEFFLNHTLSVGAQKSWVYKEKTLFYAGISSMFGFSDPDAAERDEYGLFGGTHLRLTDRLAGDLYYRLALFDFKSGQRDFNQMIIPSLTYRFNEWCEVNASFSFVINESNRSRSDYNAITTGGGVSLKLQF